jgi:hypothetical protein
MPTKEDFVKELKALMLKHDVEINWDYDDCSDLHGVTNQAIVIETAWTVPKNRAWKLRLRGQGFCANSL